MLPLPHFENSLGRQKFFPRDVGIFSSRGNFSCVVRGCGMPCDISLHLTMECASVCAHGCVRQRAYVYNNVQGAFYAVEMKTNVKNETFLQFSC